MRTVSVNIVSDFICPWCHIGDARLSRATLDLPADIAVQVRWLPFELKR